VNVDDGDSVVKGMHGIWACVSALWCTRRVNRRMLFVPCARSVCKNSFKSRAFLCDRSHRKEMQRSSSSASSRGVAHSFREFLKRARGENREGKKTVAVIGNQAADLDSVVSAAVMGYILDLEMAQSHDSTQVQVVPVMNTPRRDVRLRTELSFLFSELGFKADGDDFITSIDEINLLALSQREHGLSLALVDHNALCDHQAEFSPYVERIIDHHIDEHHDFPALSPRARDIALVGSCCTLIFEYWHSSRIPNLRDALFDSSALHEMKYLLLATILLDTANLVREGTGARVTPRDVEAANVLALQLDMNESQRLSLFTRVRTAKFDKSGLSNNELLRSDYKQYTFGKQGKSLTVVGVSSVPRSLQDFSAAAIMEFTDERRLGLHVLMGAFSGADGNFRRQLVLFSTDSSLVRQAVKGLSDSKDPVFLLERLHDGTCGAHVEELNGSKAGILERYEQKNLKISRKLLQPALARIFES